MVSKTDKNILTNHEYGWCVQQAFNETEAVEAGEEADQTQPWDCMRVRTILNPFLAQVDDTWSSTFTILDGYTPSIDDFTTEITFLPDNDVQLIDDKTKNWVSQPDSSSKACTYKAGRPPFIFVNCELVNAHWVRNFTTDNPEQDLQLQLTREYANNTEFKVRGWHKTYQDTAYSRAAGVVEIGEEQTVKLVSYAFADAVLPEPEPEELPEEDIVYNVTVDYKQVTLLE